MIDVLDEAAIQRLTGGRVYPRAQLKELHRQGFVRARLGRDGRVILERPHYEAVCRGEFAKPAAASDTSRPSLRSARTPA